MFSNGFALGKSRGHGRPKKESNSKKHHVRNWMHSKKKGKHGGEANLFPVIMSSGDSSPPPQASISSSAGFDVLDDARLQKVVITPVTSTKPPSKPTADAAKDNTEEIEEAVPIVQKTLPTPEPKPEIEKNGFDVNAKKSPDEPDDACLINCIYYTQQCCECTIV